MVELMADIKVVHLAGPLCFATAESACEGMTWRCELYSTFAYEARGRRPCAQVVLQVSEGRVNLQTIEHQANPACPPIFNTSKTAVPASLGFFHCRNLHDLTGVLL